jgi:His-Xaa-Ser system protein HxsD
MTIEETNELKNIEFKKDCAMLTINPEIFPLEIIYSAAYILIDKAFIVLDGDPKEQILVEIRKKEESQELRKIVQDFYGELLNYSVYKKQTDSNAGVREIILQRALLTNDPHYMKLKQISRDVDDPKGIKKRWEENEQNRTE